MLSILWRKRPPRELPRHIQAARTHAACLAQTAAAHGHDSPQYLSARNNAMLALRHDFAQMLDVYIRHAP